VFRLSLRDSLAMPFMMQSVARRGLRHAGLLLTNTAWGRSNLAAARQFSGAHARPSVVGTTWYNWTEKTVVDKYRKLRDQGAQAVVLVANDDEAALLVREVAQLPAAQRIPLVSHWGITGGRFFEEAGAALKQVDFTVIQTFSFLRARPEPLARFMAAARKAADIARIEQIRSPVGVAHAYDMTHILARAIRLAGSADRSAVRDALERVPSHAGLIRRYAPPFTRERHEALGPQELLMARYRDDGVLVPADA
jgi:branched-chain amino acid transport system substrate-binding protein